ncbi:C40 family peptidase [Pseudoflavonifractor sp. HCP28S3_F10]|uniref:C40 family peptidase n=1 Tax=Pseudoflavonifractor sp. HCP28S3_F10 TaxID=3438947 RepID=UPI003F8BA1D7
MHALICSPACSLFLHPQPGSERADEVLSGDTVELLEQPCPGWYRVRTSYRYEGYLRDGPALCSDPAAVRDWNARPLAVVGQAFCDVLSGPRVGAALVETLPRGALVLPLGEDLEGWRPVGLCGGRQGYVKSGHLIPRYTAPVSSCETAFRAAVAAAARSYLGAQYRWGGRTPLGIDCSGLAFMAYRLNGVTIYRDARMEPGFPVHPIPLSRMDTGDLIFFPGHVAVSLGGGRYIHSTARAGSDGVVINSLNPEHSDYREDLARSITAVGSIF